MYSSRGQAENHIKEDCWQIGRTYLTIWLSPGDGQDGGRVPDQERDQEEQSSFNVYRVFVVNDEKVLAINDVSGYMTL